MSFAINPCRWLWGWNKYGQIGNGTTENAYLPVHVHISRSSLGHLSPNGSSSSSSSEEHLPTRGAQWFPPAFSRSFSADDYDYRDGKRLKEFIRSVSIGWKHSLVLTSSHKIFGWGDIHFSVLSEVGLDVACTTRFGLKESFLSIDDLEAGVVADVFSKPTQLFICDRLINSSSRKTSPQSFLDLYGCSNSTLTLLGIDVEKVNTSMVNKATKVVTSSEEKISSTPEPTILETKGNEAEVRSKVPKAAALKPTFISPEAKSKSKGIKPGSAAAKTNQKKEMFSPLFTKVTPTKSISFNVDPIELKERFRAELKRRDQEKKLGRTSLLTATTTTTTVPATAIHMATPSPSTLKSTERQAIDLISPATETKSNSPTSNLSTIIRPNSSSTSTNMMMMMSDEKVTFSPLRIDLDSPVMRQPSMPPTTQQSPQDSSLRRDNNSSENLSDDSIKVMLFEALQNESKEETILLVQQPTPTTYTAAKKQTSKEKSSQPPVNVRKSLPLPTDSMLQLFSAQQLSCMRQRRQEKQQQQQQAESVLEVAEGPPELKVFIL